MATLWNINDAQDYQFSENPQERAMYRDMLAARDAELAQAYGITNTAPTLSSLANPGGLSKVAQIDNLIEQWSTNKDQTLPTLSITPEQRAQLAQQIAANPTADYKQFLTPDQRQVAQTYETFAGQQSGFDPISKALMAGMIGGFGALAGPSLFGAGEAAGAGGGAASTGTGAAAGGVGELGGAAPWWEGVAASTPSEIASTGLSGVSGALDAALPLSAAGAGGLAGAAGGGALSGGLPTFTGGAGGGGATAGGAATGGGALATGATGAGTTAGGSVLSNILGGNGTASDWTQLLGGVGSSLLGVAGANAQGDAYSDVADKYLALGAPYRSLLTQSYAPGFSMADQPDFQNALDIGAQAAARATSAKYGNPVDNPGAYAEMQKYITGSLALPQLNTYRSQLGSFGQLGTNVAGTGDINAAGQTGGMYNALGYGLGQLTQPQSMFGGNNSTLSNLLLNTGKYL